MASHCFQAVPWLFQYNALAPRTLSACLEHQEYSQALQSKKSGGQERRVGRLMWAGRGKVTMGYKKTTGTPLREGQLWKSHLWAWTYSTEEESCRPLAHKQSLAQGGDYKEDREASNVEEVQESMWWAWEKRNGNTSTPGSNTKWASLHNFTPRSQQRSRSKGTYFRLHRWQTVLRFSTTMWRSWRGSQISIPPTGLQVEGKAEVGISHTFFSNCFGTTKNKLKKRNKQQSYKRIWKSM